jgi:hypothetical protein
MFLDKARARAVLMLLGTLCTPLIHTEDRQVDPTWLYRDVSAAGEKPSDITTPTCHYKPLFGVGDQE